MRQMSLVSSLILGKLLYFSLRGVSWERNPAYNYSRLPQLSGILLIILIRTQKLGKSHISVSSKSESKYASSVSILEIQVNKTTSSTSAIEPSTFAQKPSSKLRKHVIHP